MTLPFDADILPGTVGLRLCKIIRNDELHMSETVMFLNRSAVVTVLNRASICGHVGGPINRDANFWADQFDGQGDHIGEILLDRKSWNSLKNHWMRCKMVDPTGLGRAP